MPLTQITGEGVGTTSTTATLAVGNTTITGAATYTTSIKSTTALATPSALTATQATAFASTVSGSVIMGFGTTNDVSLMNRAGTVVLGVGPNTTAVNIPGTLAVTGTVTGGTYNGQTISSAANFTGTVTTVSSIQLPSAVYLRGFSTGAGVYRDLIGMTAASKVAIDGAGVGATTGDSLTVANLLTVSGLGQSTFSAGGNSSNSIRVENTSAGTGAIAAVNLRNDGTWNGGIRVLSSTFTTSGPDLSDGMNVHWNGPSGMSIAATHASGTIRFYSGGTTLAGTFDTSQQLSLANNLFLGLGTYGNPALILNGTTSGNPYILFQQNSVVKVELQYIDSTDRFNIINASGGVYLGAAGTAWAAISDARLKTALTPFSDAAAKLRAVRTGTGRYLTDDPSMSRSFLIAQDWQKILPEAVDVDSGGMLSMRYTDTIPFIISAWQQHDATIATLTTQNTALEARIATLEARLAQ